MSAPRGRRPGRVGRVGRVVAAAVLAGRAAFAQAIVPPEPVVRSPAHTPADVRLEQAVEVVL
ncbi:MAG TPA: hypothetical protein VFS00_12735, partial [Polyangiaceae bacterium]|nr:hypothetical protein [Polyangiaceae bacterium]